MKYKCGTQIKNGDRVASQTGLTGTVNDLYLFCNNEVDVKFDKNGYTRTVRSNGLTLIESYKEMKEKEMSNKLYEFELTGIKQFGTQIATNQDGKAVIEIKPSGDVILMDMKDLTEVVPYKVSISKIGSGVKSTIEIEKGKLDVNDIVFTNTGEMYRVDVIGATTATTGFKRSAIIGKMKLEPV